MDPAYVGTSKGGGLGVDAGHPGRSGGGNSYGYDVVRSIGENGEAVRGERINPEQAAIVQRIFADYAEGVSPRAVAKQLNVVGPQQA